MSCRRVGVRDGTVTLHQPALVTGRTAASIKHSTKLRALELEVSGAGKVSPTLTAKLRMGWPYFASLSSTCKRKKRTWTNAHSAPVRWFKTRLHTPRVCCMNDVTRENTFNCCKRTACLPHVVGTLFS